MEVIATNIGKSTVITWNGKEERTGIFKYPISEPLLLEKEAVAKDTISNRKVHGGVHKACYLYSSDQYPYWKALYPDLSWDWGMLGENLTVKGLDESQIRIGDIFKVGTALVQISQPREPCYKLGIRFGDQKILRQFITHGAPGTYVRVLKEGEVATGDHFQLHEISQNPLTVKQFFELLYARKKNPDILHLAITNKSLPEHKRQGLKKYL
ncbi:MAG: MOSC domain-containing protein [Bacteroidota bacterium]